MSAYECCDNKDMSSFSLEATQIMPGRYPNPTHYEKRKDNDRDRHDDHHHDNHRHDDHRHDNHRHDDHRHDDHRGDQNNHNNRRPGGSPPGVAPMYAKPSGAYRIDQGAITGCLYNYTYVWLRNGRSFWFFPTYISFKSISGYRWSSFGWSYTGLDLDLIDYFTCSRY